MKTDFKVTLDLFLSQVVGLLLCGFVSVMANGLFDSRLGSMLVSSVTALIYCAFAYVTLWRQGFKDRNYVSYGHMEKDAARGFRVGLYANIPLLIVVIVYYISLFLALAGKGIYIYANIAMRLCFSPFLSFVDASVTQFPPVVILLLFATPLAAQFGYFNGQKDFSIRERLVYSKKTEKKAVKS